MNKIKLKEELAKANDDYSNWINGDTPSDFNEYMRQSQKLTDKIQSLSMEIKKLNGPVYESIPDYGNKMSLEDFKSSCLDGCFIDYDGHGYYAMKDKMSDFPIFPSDITDNKMINNFEYNFTHVIWFNK